MPVIRLYHGTAHGFDAFDGRFAMRGSEPNSALGIHLTEDPAIAASYAEMAARDRGAGKPCVLAVDVDIDRALLVDSVEDFMGRPLDVPIDSDTMRGWSEFTEARLRLEDLGYHAVALDTPIDDLAGAWTVFDPARTNVVSRIPLEEAFEMESQTDWSEVEMASGTLFDPPAKACP